MSQVHEIRFPNYNADINARKRTLFHIPIAPGSLDRFEVGDGLRLIAHPNFPRCVVGVLTHVSCGPLEVTAEDLPKLNVADAETYLARWDALHGGSAAVDKPTVWRIGFRYGFKDEQPTTPEEALAG
jgi:hypothetical protein